MIIYLLYCCSRLHPGGEGSDSPPPSDPQTAGAARTITWAVAHTPGNHTGRHQQVKNDSVPILESMVFRMGKIHVGGGDIFVWTRNVTLPHHGVSPSCCFFFRYTREAGVRSLERKIGAVCRAVAVKVAEGVKKTQSSDPELSGEPRGESVVSTLSFCGLGSGHNHTTSFTNKSFW